MHLAGIYRACLFGVSRGVAILIFKEQHREIDDGGVRFHGTFGPRLGRARVRIDWLRASEHQACTVRC